MKKLWIIKIKHAHEDILQPDFIFKNIVVNMDAY